MTEQEYNLLERLFNQHLRWVESKTWDEDDAKISNEVYRFLYPDKAKLADDLAAEDYPDEDIIDDWWGDDEDEEDEEEEEEEEAPAQDTTIPARDRRGIWEQFIDPNLDRHIFHTPAGRFNLGVDPIQDEAAPQDITEEPQEIVVQERDVVAMREHVENLVLADIGVFREPPINLEELRPQEITDNALQAQGQLDRWARQIEQQEMQNHIMLNRNRFRNIQPIRINRGNRGR